MTTMNFLPVGGEMLTKEEMKKIEGGYIGCDVTEDGENIGYFLCGGSACDCQDQLDKDCMDDPSCDDIDCGCK